ncbi:MAG: PEP-CTERM/exosortase system-associated acyltransferase [Congregibacter sp.]
MPDSAKRQGIAALFIDFAQYFELSLALTEEDKAAVYAIRYNVYCEEFGYEDPKFFEDGKEHDEFDGQSVHCLVTHKSTGVPAGCVRLVLAKDGEMMPFENHCRESVQPDVLARLASDRGTMAEISRLAVDGRFRRRRGEKSSRYGDPEAMRFDVLERRTFPLIAVSLFLAAAAVADLRQRPGCFAIMEPFLPAILSRTGVHVQRVGEDFDFRGTRAPYFLQIDEAIRDAPAELLMCFDAVRNQFRPLLEAWSDSGTS